MRTRNATAAASRYGGREGSANRLCHALAALEVRDGTGEQIANLRRCEVAVQEPVTRDGDRRRLLRDDEHRRGGFRRQTERGAGARAEARVGGEALAERKR